MTEFKNSFFLRFLSGTTVWGLKSTERRRYHGKDIGVIQGETQKPPTVR